RQSKRMAEYVGMMSQGDKEYIQKVQIAQLVGEEGDDFYCQMYLAVRRLLPPSSFNGSSKSQGAGNASSSHQGSDRRNGPGEGAGRSRMQQQIQRIVQDARARTKKSQVSKEGALGKVSVLSARNPKQSLQIAASKSPGSSVPPSPKGEEGRGRHEALLATERVYELVLGLEQMVRTRPPPPRSSLDEEGYEATMRWNERYEQEAQRLLEEIGLAERVARGYDRFIGILSTGKGKRLLPRVLRHCTVDQAYGLAKGVAEVLERLDVCSSLPPRQDVEQVELYMSMVHPAFMSLLAEAGPVVILDLWASLMNRGAVAVQWLARTKPGLGFLTMCMSRAQLLREAGALDDGDTNSATAGAAPSSSSPASTARWEQLYLQLLRSLRGHFASLFPPAPSPGPHHLPITTPPTTDPLVGAEEEGYVWQFLSLMAVGARDVGLESQHILVSEVRDRVHEAVWAASHQARSPEDAAQRILNVNLFLHPLHLDASQVA
ncbi:MAG: topoisomerase II-associated protein PAT1, partial [Piptocephalis tieghemiana]